MPGAEQGHPSLKLTGAVLAAATRLIQEQPWQQHEQSPRGDPLWGVMLKKEAEAGPVESLGVSVRVRTRGTKKKKKKKTRHNNLVRSLTERAHVQSNTKCEQ